jgi:hypothetical protein
VAVRVVVWGAVALTVVAMVRVRVPDHAVSLYPLANFCASSAGVAAVMGSYVTPG